MEIVRERLERELDISILAPAPSVEYLIPRTAGEVQRIDNPSDVPSAIEMREIEEPYLLASIITPSDYTGTLMDLCQSRRGELKKMEYISPERLELVYRLPLGEVVMDFFDQMKSRSQGYASMD